MPAQNPVLALVKFKNLQQAQATLYKLTEAQLSQFQVLKSRMRNNNQSSLSVKAPRGAYYFITETCRLRSIGFFLYWCSCMRLRISSSMLMAFNT
jgi:hypothetical protein